ncbi:DUF1481 domain-containing protein [Grimontia sedimenti]|uniref:DUF1481 domain-containing protein n=1 Tax=Grimontia sedimenti TaxID=2711294 RepID=UPI0022A793F6|nr:DUF1481 domain-containing protein [Grimontia sedimenti]
MLPIRTTELIRYYQQAEKALETAKALGKNNKSFFQGYWNEGVFEECGSGEVKTLKFSAEFPDYILRRLKKEDNFIAAVGKVGRNTNAAETIIVLDNDSADCFERPEF